MGDQQREQVESILATIRELTDEHLLMRIAKTATSRRRSLALERIKQRETDAWRNLPAIKVDDIIYFERRPRRSGRLAPLRDKPLVVVHINERACTIAVRPIGGFKIVALTALDIERHGISFRPTPGAVEAILIKAESKCDTSF